jgi:hypothetical protein
VPAFPAPIGAQERVSIAFGPLAVALRMPPDVASGRLGWLRPWQPVFVEAEVALDGTGARPAQTHYDRCDATGFVFQTGSARGEGTWCDRRARVWLADDGSDDALRRKGLCEAAFAIAYAAALLRGGTALHASAILVDGAACVVAGPSGGGKSTLRKRFPESWLQDEHAFLVPDGKRWVLWQQPELAGCRDPRPHAPPLTSVHVIDPSDRTRTTAALLPAADALAELLPHGYFAGGVATSLWVDGMARLAESVPVRRLHHCLRDDQAARSPAAATDRERTDG